ncbi:MAG: restriction endonuclease subunit S [Caldilineaceae bacterium]|nr:restriction endonuclease subunit S [Caldilineaceae bacterium]
MKTGWETKKLGDLFDITSSKRVFKSEWKQEGVPFYRAREIVKLANQGFVDNELFISQEMFDEYSAKSGIPQEGDIMVTGVGTLGICYVVRRNDRFYFKDGNIIWLKKVSDASSRFVEYAFQSDFIRKQIDDSVGATVGTFTIIKAKNTLIPIPPLTEQQRIVAILDEAFDGIATATANAEQNLQNARALFESYLDAVFRQRGEGWVEKRLEDVCVLQRGFDLPTRSRVQGEFPLVSSSGIIDTHNKGPVKGPGVATGRSGSIGNVFFVEEDYWPLNTVLYVKQFHGNSPRFVYRLLKHFDLKRFASGAGVPTLNRNFVHDELVTVPKSKTMQDRIAERLDEIEQETQRLETIYQRKLAALDELKQSLLHQAFAGDL